MPAVGNPPAERRRNAKIPFVSGFGFCLPRPRASTDPEHGKPHGNGCGNLRGNEHRLPRRQYQWLDRIGSAQCRRDFQCHGSIRRHFGWRDNLHFSRVRSDRRRIRSHDGDVGNDLQSNGLGSNEYPNPAVSFRERHGSSGNQHIDSKRIAWRRRRWGRRRRHTGYRQSPLSFANTTTTPVGTWTNGNPCPSGQFSTGDDSLANAICSVPPSGGGGGGTPPYVGPTAVNGCGVEWTGLLTFTVGQCTYIINGITYNSPITNLTLAAADATNPRIDAIIVDNTGVASAITGTPAASPVDPTTDPSTQLALTFVEVAANATTPTGITSETIYDENVEWTTAKGGTNSARVTLNSTNNPYSGTVDIEFGVGGTVTTTTYAQATKPAAGTENLSTWNSLIFYIRNKAAWATNRSVTIQWYNGATAVGTAIVLNNNNFGFNATTNVTGYQQIIIPTTYFGTGSAAVTTVRFTVSGSGAALTGFYLDRASLQAGTNPTPPLPTTLMNWKGTYSAAVNYLPNDTVTVNGCYYVALAANLNVPVTTTATWAGTGSCATAKTGQVLVAQNGAPSVYLTPGIADGNGGAPVTTTPYTLKCDSSTAVLDGAHLIRFQSGAATVTVPLSTATGCTGNNMAFTTVDDGAGTLTVNRTSADTFSTFDGTTATDGATSFSLASGQYATLNQGAAGIWEVRISPIGIVSNNKIRSFGTTFGDTGGSALTSGSTVYFTVPYACTITAWNATVDAGTVTFDVWKIATGTAIPTISNTITASALPAISTGTAKHSTILTGWTTSVTANDIFGINLNTVATAKYAELDLQCNQ